MDHISLPRDRDPWIIDVPLLAEDVHRYDGQGFDTFPARCGLKNEIITSDKTPYEIQSFVQAWLFFGTLKEIFGPSFQQDDFVRNDIFEQQFIDTTLLPTYIDSYGLPYIGQRRSKWNLAASLRREVAIVRSKSRIREVLNHAHYASQLLDRDLGEAYPEWPALMLSLRVLLESLQGLADIRLDMQLTARQPSTRLIMEHISNSSGWCKHQLIDVCASNSYIAALYLANLQQYPRKWTSHEECVFQDRCGAFNIRNETYESRHIVPGCQCEHVTAPTDDMLYILATGGIPVLRCENAQDSSLSLSYVRASPGAHYAAISHLWIDGIGNPKGNSLPECQIRRIASYVADANHVLSKQPDNSGVQASPIKFRPFFNAAEKLLSGLDKHPVDLWLDAYCVPIVPEISFESQDKFKELDRLKTTALSRMFATYAWARYTLVLDHELLSMGSEADDTELHARIAFCGWNTRCWTFQEYCLASKVVFQCDRPRLRQRRAKRNRISNRSDDILLNVFWKMSKPEYIFTGARQEIGYADDDTSASFSDDAAFATVWNYLVKRNTTKWQDVPGIFANLLGLSAAELAGLPPEDVMKATIATQRPLPLNILCIETIRCSCRPTHLQAIMPDDLWVPVAPLGERLSDRTTMAVQDGGLVLPKPHTEAIQYMFKIFVATTPKCYFTHEGRSYCISFRGHIPELAYNELLVVLCGLDLTNCAEVDRGFCLLPKYAANGVLHTKYLGPLDWFVCEELVVNQLDTQMCHVEQLQRQDLTIMIDCDIVSWQRGSVDRASLRASRRKAFTYLRPLFYTMLLFGLCLTLLIYLICILIPSLTVGQAYAVSVVTALMYLFFTVPFTLCVTYTLYEVWDYITLSQAVADRRDETTWAENVESAMPRERLGVSFFRYWVLGTILWTLIIGDKICRAGSRFVDSGRQLQM